MLLLRPIPESKSNHCQGLILAQQLSYYFSDKTMWQSFVCAMTAAVCLQAFDPFRSGKLVLYQTKYSVDWHGFEIIPYAILGIIGVRRGQNPLPFSKSSVRT